MRGTYDDKIKEASEAVKIIRSGSRVFLQGSAATPRHLINALEARAGELKNVELVNISLIGDLAITKPEYEKAFSSIHFLSQIPFAGM